MPAPFTTQAMDRQRLVDGHPRLYRHLSCLGALPETPDPRVAVRSRNLDRLVVDQVIYGGRYSAAFQVAGDAHDTRRISPGLVATIDESDTGTKRVATSPWLETSSAGRLSRSSEMSTFG